MTDRRIGTAGWLHRNDKQVAIGLAARAEQNDKHVDCCSWGRIGLIQAIAANSLLPMLPVAHGGFPIATVTDRPKEMVVALLKLVWFTFHVSVAGRLKHLSSEQLVDTVIGELVVLMSVPEIEVRGDGQKCVGIDQAIPKLSWDAC